MYLGGVLGVSVMGLVDEETEAAMATVESAAGELSHTVGSWYRREEWVWLTSCPRCQRLGWIVRPGFEAWRTGGPLLEESCEEAE